MVLNNFKSKGLGKGLAALLGESQSSESAEGKTQNNFSSEKIPTHLLKPNRLGQFIQLLFIKILSWLKSIWF